MTIEEKLKELILSRYRSVREFTQVIDMPYSTFDTILKRGIANSSVTNVIRICRELGISADALAENKIVPSALAPDPSDCDTDLDEMLNDVKSKIISYDSLTIRGKPLAPNDRINIINAIDIAIKIITRFIGQTDPVDYSQKNHNKNHNKTD